ncbi:hypothetical protein [Devosia nitrariae]|uniref:Uncharacterized protein n=1 Tax=Devosia nitrariae TaxID=2071872 RepID=A0ABQ5W2W3_9HYPH|nr:hypothetical protein [Devosia nitrariae]GLQ54161.1 hypothetical protein GCM10010862_14200 [Devosia nitrariae]
MRLDEITSILGPTDEVLAAQISRTGATEEDLAEAWAWFSADEALVNEGRAMPSGRVAELISVLEAAELDTEE